MHWGTQTTESKEQVAAPVAWREVHVGHEPLEQCRMLYKEMPNWCKKMKATSGFDVMHWRSHHYCTLYTGEEQILKQE